MYKEKQKSNVLLFGGRGGEMEKPKVMQYSAPESDIILFIDGAGVCFMEPYHTCHV